MDVCACNASIFAGEDLAQDMFVCEKLLYPTESFLYEVPCRLLTVGILFLSFALFSVIQFAGETFDFGNDFPNIGDGVQKGPVGGDVDSGQLRQADGV